MYQGDSSRWHVVHQRPCARACAAPEPPLSSGDGGDGSPETGQPQAAGPPAEDANNLSSVLSRSLSEVAKGSNRVFGSTNLLLTGESEDQWRRLDKKVNKYPIQRSFTAIGTGGQEFRKAMVAAVESVVGQVHYECIAEKHSSKGAYISVTIGPVWVENSDQIIAIYGKLKDDGRAKWII